MCRALLLLLAAACGPIGSVGSPHQGLTSERDAQGLIVSDSVARRLSRDELDNTLRDILEDETRPAARILADDRFTPFDNDYTNQQASTALIDSLASFAEQTAAALVADTARRARLVGCTPAGDGDAACFRAFIGRFGELAWRRPLTSDEIDRYLPLLAFATEQNPYVPTDFYTAVGLAIEAFLQDPEFLYRIEVGAPTEIPGVFRLDGREIASRLSYLMWGTAPDAALAAAADDGMLDGRAGRRAVAARLLADPRARTQMQRFHAMWLGYRAIPQTPQLVQAFNAETSALLDRVIFNEPQSYLAVFTARETWADDALAAHYGLPSPGGAPGWVSYDGTTRAGLLAHGSVLSGFGKFSDTSPTQRGIFVRTRLMCDTIPPPPADVDVDQAPEAESGSPCKYDRYAAHRSVASCAACHSNMDPIGFGLENYNLGGQWRDHDDGLPECGIAGTGELPGYGAFSGPASLAQQLIDAGELDDCMVEHMYRFAVGRELTPDELDAKLVLTELLRDRGHLLDQLLIEYVASDVFAHRREPGT